VKVIKAVTRLKLDTRQFAFSTDEDSAWRMVELGHLDKKVRMAIKEGVPPIRAIQMATINAAEASGVADKLGSIVPGKIASLLFVDDLRRFGVKRVMLRGQIVAENGAVTASLKPPRYPKKFVTTVRIGRRLVPKDFVLTAPAGAQEVKARVIGITPGALASKELFVTLPVVAGQVPPQVDNDILKIAVIDRHTGGRRLAVGYIKGFQLRSGAIGSVYNPCVEDMVILGTDEADMALAANTLADIQGGFVVVDKGKVVATMEAPLFGILSLDGLAVMIDKSRAVDQVIASLGCPIQAPFHTLAFMAFPGHFGVLKMCNRGLANVNEGRLVDVLVHA
jgi:adenine deaminase